MKRTILCLLMMALPAAGPRSFSASAAPVRGETYELQLVYIFETNPTEYLFVIGQSGFKTIASLERFVATLPAGTTLRWSPGCVVLGGEPLLSSRADMAQFREFCAAHHIDFVLVPSG